MKKNQALFNIDCEDKKTAQAQNKRGKSKPACRKSESPKKNDFNFKKPQRTLSPFAVKNTNESKFFMTPKNPRPATTRNATKTKIKLDPSPITIKRTLMNKINASETFFGNNINTVGYKKKEKSLTPRKTEIKNKNNVSELFQKESHTNLSKNYDKHQIISLEFENKEENEKYINYNTLKILFSRLDPPAIVIDALAALLLLFQNYLGFPSIKFKSIAHIKEVLEKAVPEGLDKFYQIIGSAKFLVANGKITLKNCNTSVQAYKNYQKNKKIRSPLNITKLTTEIIDFVIEIIKYHSVFYGHNEFQFRSDQDSMGTIVIHSENNTNSSSFLDVPIAYENIPIPEAETLNFQSEFHHSFSKHVNDFENQTNDSLIPLDDVETNNKNIILSENFDENQEKLQIQSEEIKLPSEMNNLKVLNLPQIVENTSSIALQIDIATTIINEKNVIQMETLNSSKKSEQENMLSNPSSIPNTEDLITKKKEIIIEKKPKLKNKYVLEAEIRLLKKDIKENFFSLKDYSVLRSYANIQNEWIVLVESFVLLLAGTTPSIPKDLLTVDKLNETLINACLASDAPFNNVDNFDLLVKNEVINEENIAKAKEKLEKYQKSKHSINKYASKLEKIVQTSLNLYEKISESNILLKIENQNTTKQSISHEFNNQLF